ncbi:MAG TPA: right-handed parallel beta-helix repeat-containing protein [Mycobacteriales bacterium]|jgi:parallel beta-helix repeat protein
MSARQLFGSLLVASLLAVPVGAADALPPDCDNIAPSTSATTNYANIQGCLDSVHRAGLLSSSDYLVSQGIAVNSDELLYGRTASTLRLAASPPTSYLVYINGDHSHVTGLKLDAAGRLDPGNVIVLFSGASTTSYNTVDYNEIVGGGIPTSTPFGNPNDVRGAATLSFSCSQCTGNVVAHNDIHHNYRGIVFHGTNKLYNNEVRDNEIHHMQCASVEFVGYGTLRRNHVYENGGYCRLGRGGGIYSEDNSYGGVIDDNTIDRMCGHGIDMIQSMNLTITYNTVTNPGTLSADPTNSTCGTAAAISLVDVRTSTVEYNTASNTNPYNMRKYDMARKAGFQDTGATAFRDLPLKENTLIAFQLVWTHNTTWTSRSNHIYNNRFTANCSWSSCLGVPMFVGRGTGLYSTQSSDSASWNKFAGNRIYGSETDTTRGGRNWWAGNDVCDSSGDWAYDHCNDDDYNHNPPNGTTFRSDLTNAAGDSFVLYS